MNLPTAALLLALAVSAPLSKAVSNVATSCASGPNKFPPGSTGRGLPSGGLTVWIGNVDLSVGIPDNDDQLFSPVGRCTGDNGLCQMCQGDCDGDDECAPGLICYGRPRDQDVPFCKGLAVTGKDYCSKPIAGGAVLPPGANPEDIQTLRPDLDFATFPKVDRNDVEFSPIGTCTGPMGVNGWNLCELCQGDCDDDTECINGLRCLERSNDAVVPGCYGLAASDKDYCVTNTDYQSAMASLLPEEEPIFVNPAECDATFSKCGNCQGDCDLDEHCDEGLVCFQREAMESVPGCSGSAPSGADICTSPDWIDFVNGNARRLSESEPEASAQGERRTQQGGPIIVQTGRTYNVWLTAPEGGPEVTFKGFLFRLSGNERQDVSGALGLSPISFDYSEILASDGERAAEPGVAPASCAPGVSGAGHTDAFGKTQVVVEMTIPPTATGSMSLEVSALLTDTVWFMTTFRFTAANENSMLLPEQPEIATFPPTAAPDPEAPVEKKQFAPLGECTGFRNGRPVCLQCQGDCDDDTECGQGLICHQRKGSEKVPHCRGDAVDGADYCSFSGVAGRGGLWSTGLAAAAGALLAAW